MGKSYREIGSVGEHTPTALAPREARLPAFIGAPQGAGEKLGDLRVAQLGCGSVGQVIGLHLARLQVAGISLVDRGKLKVESMITHSAMVPEDLGHPKATFLGRKVKEISPATRVFVYDGELADIGLAALASADLAILATDNLLVEILAARYCRLLGLPLVQASLHGETMTVQVRFFANKDGGVCPVCGFSAMEFQALNEQTTFSCETLTGQRETPRTTGPVTSSTSFLCSLAAELCLVQVLRFWLGLGTRENVEDCLVEYCGYSHKSTVCPLTRNPHCAGVHDVYRRVPTNHAISDSSTRQLLLSSGLGTAPSLAGVSLRLDDLVYVEKGRCGCDVSQPVGRFRHAGPNNGRAVESCDTCGQPVSPQPFWVHDPVPLGLLGGVLDRPLAELGAEEPRWAMVHGPAGGVLIGF